jgi:hypothetical protein
MGPNETIDVVTAGDGGTQIPWDYIESGAVTPDEDVPFTPRVTGLVLFKGVVVVKNNSLSPVNVLLEVQVDDAGVVPPILEETVTGNGLAAIPFELLTTIPLAVGTLVNVQVLVAASVNDAITLNVDASTIEIEEVLPATG